MIAYRLSRGRRAPAGIASVAATRLSPTGSKDRDRLPAAPSFWSLVRLGPLEYAEKVRSQFLSLRQNAKAAYSRGGLAGD
jgi:hypothetical protein